MGAQGLRRDSLAYFGFFAVFACAMVLGLSTYVVPLCVPRMAWVAGTVTSTAEERQQLSAGFLP